MIEDGEVSGVFLAVFASILIIIFLTKILVGIFSTMKHSGDCTDSVPSSFFCKAVMS